MRSAGWLIPDFAPPGPAQDECRQALQAMQQGGFAMLGVSGRLALLRALCDACLQAPVKQLQTVYRPLQTVKDRDTRCVTLASRRPRWCGRCVYEQYVTQT